MNEYIAETRRPEPKAKAPAPDAQEAEDTTEAAPEPEAAPESDPEPEPEPEPEDDDAVSHPATTQPPLPAAANTICAKNLQLLTALEVSSFSFFFLFSAEFIVFQETIEQNSAELESAASLQVLFFFLSFSLSFFFKKNIMLASLFRS